MNGREQASVTPDGRLGMLLRMLESDPQNLTLLLDAAETALTEQKPEVAAELLDRHSEIRPLPPHALNLAGLAAMQSKRFDSAADLFVRLIDAGVDDPSVSFNLAWSRAMLKDFDGALELLVERVVSALPQAAMLHVQILHQQGAFEAAAEIARSYLELHPDDPGLMAAVSVLALDVEDAELAERCAAKAGDHPDALTTLGTLALGDDRPADALAIFDRALDLNQHLPRAWVGRGLAKLMAGNTGSAAADVDRGAEMFEKHLGSWIAAGWTHFVNQDLATSRARFEKALALDPTFAESHGSLAVIDILEGRVAEGKAGCEVALRLDRHCYSGALAKVLLSASAGDHETARRIFDLAINAPVDDSGRTIAQALAKLGMSG